MAGSSTSSTPAEHADPGNLSTFEDLPQMTIYTREGWEQYVDSKLLNNQVDQHSWI
jgi:hypothetical protein